MDEPKNKRERAIYGIYADEIIRNFAREMRQKYNLYCISKGGRMPHDVEEIEMDFNYYHTANIEQARELEVIVTEGLVKYINAHEKIRPFLREYPFTYKRALVSISFEDKNFTKCADESVFVVFQAKGNLCFFSENPQTKKLELLLREPYEKSLEIVRNKNNAIP